MSDRRRNGSEASCEPCRRSKLRCDHARPVCNRCHRRSLQLKCFYHPAPLTRPPVQPAQGPAGVELAPLNSVGAASGLEPAGASLTAGSKRLRRTSPTEQPTLAAPRQCTIGSVGEEEERLILIREALSALDHFDTMRESIHDYYTDSMAANVPRPLILPAISSLTGLVGVSKISDRSQEGTTNLQRLTQSVRNFAARNIPISESTSVEEFLSHFTGANIRLEFLGIILAVAGRGYLSSMGKAGVHDVFTRTMTRCCGICYRLARELTPMNDVIAWLSLEQVTLAMNVYGDQSEQVWRGLGDLSSDILACSQHREASIGRNYPKFLAECRRRTSSKSYYLDVCISSTMGRPPRLSKRFFDANLPLDLSDEDLCGTPDNLAEATAKLDPSGWNIDTPEYWPASFARLRPSIARIREEAWELELRPNSPESVSQLQELSRRNRQIWDQVPTRLQYTSACWHSGVAPRVCQMLMNMYLAYAATEFHICRAIKRADAKASSSLLTISVEIVTRISELGAIRMKDAVYDFSFQSLYHGWPAAVVLLESLQGFAREGTGIAPLPPGITASRLVRLLSVLAHQLRTLCDSRQTNHTACVQAAETIGSRLDEITGGLFDRTQRDDNIGPGTSIPETGSTFIDPVLWSDSDMVDLLKDVDWNNISTEWGL